MTAKERKKAFKAYLEDTYRPMLTDAELVLKTHTSLSVSLVGLNRGYTSIFEVEDKSILSELLIAIKNPGGGKMAFGRQVKNLGFKEAFLRHYSLFLDKCTSETSPAKTHVSANSEMDDEAEEKYLEGQLKETKFFKRKRNKALRDECLRRYGYKCFVCGFDFEKVYGIRGKHYIEVHHLNPMANYDDEHSITADDLRPLCSNCHSMIHRDPNGGTTDIETFKTEYNRINTKQV